MQFWAGAPHVVKGVVKGAVYSVAIIAAVFLAPVVVMLVLQAFGLILAAGASGTTEVRGGSPPTPNQNLLLSRNSPAASTASL